MPYFDHAATSPMPAEVIDAWVAANQYVGNGSSTHRDGQRARLSFEEAREAIGAALGAKAFDTTITGSGTEAINLAIKGIFWARNGMTATSPLPAVLPRPRIITTATEHHATTDAVEWLERSFGAHVDVVSVDADGVIDLEALAALLGDDVALVTTLWANNEIGTVQPVAQISALAARFGVPTHFDAVAALGYVPLSLTDSGASALSISAHKVGGPVGIGALAVARGTTIVPLIHGGSQQFLRSGSLDVAGTIAAAVAISRATSDVESHAARLADLRDYLRDGLMRVVPDATVRGSETHRVAGNLHVTIPGVDSAYLLFALDEAGFSVSAGSACTAGVESESHVLRAIGASDARGALRMTLGVTNTREEIDEFLQVLPGLIDRVRGIGSV
ncbi:cysteine desulfurase [Microbacteriaceae bacterium MWH-Ta3]|nr:cysteine desulfurase [Microbacteriaceae bacterium MWH-Ta3]